ncbi:serine/threonine-protein phosphatase 6 regulatory ankyrin repeat subunit B [Patella vulgata]|uniref:serine/threonine-protein phosphatase 6 regulatory ankyrin repeat subunit B n=1 Tax=Patella vulgata TaxID=6465 RepID=UPI0021809566|nr:serine/threonine-protein phosphatase 6 regulatory ankyrin repeat subunit B [Patella vulgata]
MLCVNVRFWESIQLNRIEDVRLFLQQMPNTAVAKNKFRKEGCKQALQLRNLVLTQLLYTNELIYNRTERLDTRNNIELLSSAIESDFVEGFKFLLNCGLSFECGFWSALFEAVVTEKIQILKYLISFPVLCVNSKFHETILTVACKKGNLEIVSILLKHQQVKDVINCVSLRSGLSALHLCIDWFKCETTCLLFVMALVEAGADVNIVSSALIPALCSAASRGFMSVLAYLMDHGADVSVVDLNLDTVLHQIVTKPNAILFVQKLIKSGLEINLQNKFGETPLHLATKYKNECIVDMLLKTHGCGVDLSDKMGITPLMLAVEQNEIGFIKLLSQHGADVNKQDIFGESSLHRLIQNGNKSVVDVLLSSRACDINLSDKWGITPFMFAIEQNETQIAKLLHQHGANINKQNICGRSPLHLAIRYGNKSVVDVLLKAHGCVVNLSDGLGITPFMLAVEQNETQIAKLLFQHGVDVNKQDILGKSPLHRAIQNGNKIIVDDLLKAHGCDVNLSDGEGITPIMLAVEQNKTQIAKLLFQHGVDVNKQDTFGKSPLHRAIQNGNKIIVDDLLKAHGCDVNLSDGEGITPVMLAVEQNETQIAKLLFQHGVDVNKQDTFGKSPLHRAIQNGNKIIVDDLLKAYGCDVNLSDGKGITPLILAVEQNETQIAKCLHQHGANINKQDINGRSPLHRAIQNGNKSIVSVLLEIHGCDVNLFDNQNISPLMSAVKNKNLELIKCLCQHEADINKQDSLGRSAIYYAFPNHRFCFSFYDTGNEIEIMKLLESFGAEFRTQNRGNELVKNILRASGFGYFQHLVDSSKIDFDDIDENGDNILHVLARVRDLPTTSLDVFLNGEGVDINLKNSTGNTPLMVAAVLNNVPYMKILVDHGCKLDINNCYGHTVLHLCVLGLVNLVFHDFEESELNLECLDVVLCKAIDVNVHDLAGMTALMIAAQLGEYNFVKKLLTAGGDIKILDKTGKPISGIDFYSVPDLKLSKSIMRSCGVDTTDRMGLSMMDLAGEFIERNQFPNALVLISYLVAANYHLKNTHDRHYFYEAKESTRIIDLWKLLYESGAARVDIVSKLNFIPVEDEDQPLSIESEFHSFCNNLSLRSMCRRIIRQRLGSNIKERVTLLKLPMMVQNFLLLKCSVADKYFSLETDDDDEDGDDNDDDGGGGDDLEYNWESFSLSDFCEEDYYDIDQ